MRYSIKKTYEKKNIDSGKAVEGGGVLNRVYYLRALNARTVVKRGGGCRAPHRTVPEFTFTIR